MEFRTERLLLRPWKESDAENLYNYAKNPEVGPIAGWPVHTSMENSRDIIKHVLSAAETYAVCLKEDNRAIGSIGLMLPMQSHTKAADDEMEIGYWIGAPFWGNGYIPEAVRRLLEHAFVDLECSAMWCGYYDGNEKSRRVQEKCGFVCHHTEENKKCASMGDVRTEHFTYLTKEQWKSNQAGRRRTAVLYVHGKGGSALEAEHYKNLFTDCDVYGLDYQMNTPWETKPEIQAEAARLKRTYHDIILVANSIGAFFSMNAGIDAYLKKAYLISPIVNMEKLICDMMHWSGITEAELSERKEIPTTFGETLSWDYLCYVRNHPVVFRTPADILYGKSDQMTSYETVAAFANRFGATITVMEHGEHWFHTDEQMGFLDNWILANK